MRKVPRGPAVPQILEEGDAPLDEKSRGHMAMGNGALRDPVAFRCNPERHWRTGDKYEARPALEQSVLGLAQRPSWPSRPPVDPHTG